MKNYAYELICRDDKGWALWRMGQQPLQQGATADQSRVASKAPLIRALASSTSPKWART